jgi:hypothetical protein
MPGHLDGDFLIRSEPAPALPGVSTMRVEVGWRAGALPA